MLLTAVTLVVLPATSAAQTLSGIKITSPLDVALISNNVSASDQATFQVYDETFLKIIGSSPTMTLAVNETIPYFHEAGVVNSNNPLTLYSTSNQYNTVFASPLTNKNVVISRTIQNNITGEWTHEVVHDNTSPMSFANGGFQYQDGILFDVQGSLEAPAGLVYLPTNIPDAKLSQSYTIINNYLGKPFNSPNDVYVTRNGVIYFTDPAVGYIQNFRPKPSLPPQVYAFVPNTTIIKPVADHFDQPNGIAFSPDERTVYITDSIGVDPATNLSSFRTIYAFDVVYPSARGNLSATPMRGEVPYFTNRRIFAMPSLGIPDGIKCDTLGNVYVGAGDGLQVYSSQGILLGKVLVDGGVANFGFASDGRILAMNEKRLWLIQLDRGIQPAVSVGERRG